MNKIENIKNEIERLQKELLRYKKYQNACILKPATKLDFYINFKEKVQKIVELEEFEELGFKELAYEIKGNKKGFYITMRFVCEPQKITELENFFRKNDDIIKFITILDDGKEF